MPRTWSGLVALGKRIVWMFSFRILAGIVMRALTGLRRRWSVYGVYDNEWGNEQIDGVVETGHGGMQEVTGMSMLSCSFRWPCTAHCNI